MEAAAVRLYFLLEHTYSLVTMSCILHIIWVNSCTRNKINFSKDNIARGLCTLVPFIVPVVSKLFAYAKIIHNKSAHTKHLIFQRPRQSAFRHSAFHWALALGPSNRMCHTCYCSPVVRIYCVMTQCMCAVPHCCAVRNSVGVPMNIKMDSK